PRTRAEATGYAETSTHADVLAFLDALPPDPHRHRTSFGTTPEGRALPLVVWGAPDASAAAVRATGKTRVLVFANIHAGEVDGKEAMLILLRDLAAGRHDAWADSLVLLVAPIYNADGNDRVALDNRPLQLGPTGGMGQRPNAAGLDLNRDFTKLAAAESRALVGVMRDYDPHVVVDLHTTDGTPMAYGLTYAPGLHPATPGALSADLFGRWLPQISERLAATGGPLAYHYGNVPGAFGEEASAPRGWYSFSAQPRFSSNYVGLRGRYGVLSESYSYDPFETRVRSSRRFAEEVVEQAWREASHVRRAAEAADREFVVGQDVAVRSTWAPLDGPVEVLLGRVDTVAHPTTGEPMLRNTGERLPETMPAYVRFVASETTRAPRAYAVTYGAHLQPIQGLLDAHGIAYEWGAVWGTAREGFRVDSVAVAERPSQGVRTQEVFGQWEAVPAETGPWPRLGPTILVPVDQPLGRLVVALLDPRSDDGVFAWGLVPADALVPGELAPIQRLP
ncbi:MAG TPA: M14 family metallopeptidase, partial [Rubricoccaceae bacterium]